MISALNNTPVIIIVIFAGSNVINLSETALIFTFNGIIYALRNWYTFLIGFFGM